MRLACDERLFVRVVKASFGQRRKMLRNSLRAAFGDFGGAEHPFFSQRAEQLSVADFVALTQWVEQRIGGDPPFGRPDKNAFEPRFEGVFP